MNISTEAMAEKVARDFFQLMPLLRKGLKPFEKRSEVLSPLQFHTLFFLQDQKNRSMSELAAQLDILKQQLPLLTDKLAEKNFIQRIPDEKDRRSVMVSITPAGLEFLEKFRQETLAVMTARLKQLAPAELQDLQKAIRCFYNVFNRL